MDAIWHNQYRGTDSDFKVLRSQYDYDINAVILMVARHVEQGLYDIISMNATPHMLVVVCGCQKTRNQMPADMFGEPVTH